MGFLRKDTLPKPNFEALEKLQDADKDNLISELKQELDAFKKAREAQKATEQPETPPLPPKFEGAGKYVAGQKQPADEPKIEHKIEYVPVSNYEMISMQLESMQRQLDEIKEMVKR